MRAREKKNTARKKKQTQEHEWKRINIMDVARLKDGSKIIEGTNLFGKV